MKKPTQASMSKAGKKEGQSKGPLVNRPNDTKAQKIRDMKEQSVRKIKNKKPILSASLKKYGIAKKKK